MKIIRQWIMLWAVLCWALTGTAAAVTYPAPQTETLFVQDTVGVLAPETATALNAVGLRLREATGAEAVVAVVDDLQGESVEAYATGLFRAWGIGDREKNNGVLLLVVPSARQVRIEVGYGLEGALNDAKTGAILDREFVPPMQDGDPDAAVVRTYRALCTEVAHEYGEDTVALFGTEALRTKPAREDDPLTTAFICAVILLMLYRSRGGGSGRGGGGSRGGGRGFGGRSGGGGFGGGSSGGGGAGRSW